IPASAKLIRDWFDPPKFLIAFKPPLDAAILPSIKKIEFPSARPIEVKPIQGSSSVAAFGPPGTYELTLVRTREGVAQCLPDQHDITRPDDRWEVDTGERNWETASQALGICAGSAPKAAATPGTGSDPAPKTTAAPALSATRWTATQDDYALIATATDPVLRSMVANALAEVGTYENGSEREKQRVLAYWGAVGGGLAEQASRSHVPWSGAFAAWIA